MAGAVWEEALTDEKCLATQGGAVVEQVAYC